jgi:hypothetical protein
VSVYDDPNREAIGLQPAWVEGTGGTAGEPSAAVTEAPEGTRSLWVSPDLDSMTKAELLEYAQQIDVSPANNDMTKAELRAGIDEHLAAGGG